MIIYQMTGRFSAFKTTGLMLADPIVDSSKDRLLKAVKKKVTKLKKQESKFILTVKKLVIKPLGQAEALVLFGPEGYVDTLIESYEVIACFTDTDRAKIITLETEEDSSKKRYLDDLPFR